MAVALSLLIVLPALGQTTDITDGRQANGVIDVGVFADIEDAQLAKLTASTFTPWPDPPGAPSPLPYIPIAATATPTNIGTGEDGEHALADPAYLADLRVDPKDTFFRSTLYVSNKVDAYNTVLVNVDTSGIANYTDTCVVNDPDTADVNEREAGTARVTAIVRNNRSGDSITMELVRASAGGTDSVDPGGTDTEGPADAGDYAHALFKVVEQGATGTYDPDGTPDNADDRELQFRQFDGPTWCDNAETRGFDTTPDDATDELTQVQVETAATSAAYGPIPLPGIGLPLAAAAPSADQEIATIFARHGDRLTITVPGQSGSVELTVDGDGPDFTAITPEDNDVVRSSRLSYGFEVRDDDSGLRHDGESQLTEDDDYEEINPDGDQHLETEPLSEDPNAQVPANGKAADIDVNVAVNPMSEGEDPTAATYEDISASGTWRIAGSRAGVAYAFTASGADKDDDSYLYQLRARDRAGNWSETDADDDRDAAGNQPYVFRVDNEEPDLTAVRTGISWNSEDNAEEVDRSYIALHFGGDAIGDVDTNSITIVGHTIVGYIHPSKAPAIDRNEGSPKRANFPPQFITYEPTEPTGGTQPSTRTGDAQTAWTTASTADALTGDETRPAADANLLLLEGRWLQFNEEVAIIEEAPAAADVPSPTLPDAAKPEDCSSPTTVPNADSVIVCGRYMQHESHESARGTGVSNRDAATKRHEEAMATYEKELAPGTDIEDGDFIEPRSRVYIELAEALASDETPPVQVVGGAVRDLAGNTNDAKTLSGAAIEDWIGPKLTVTVTGTAADRQVANAKGSFTVNVSADEDVSRPRVFFVALKATAVRVKNADGTDSDELTGAYDYTVGPTSDGTNEANSLTSQEEENNWSRSYKVSSADLSGFADGLVGVVVVTDDDEDNAGATAGWSTESHRMAGSPKATDKLNLEKMDAAGLLIEIDRSVLDAKEVFVTPRSDAEGKETESSNPFVKLDFSNEGGEYQVCELDGDQCKDGADVKFKDTHSRVDVPEITVNGEDATADLARIDSNEFSLVLRDLEVGEYEVWYAVTDDAGNEGEEVEGLFTFEVLPRQPYEIDVTPGWNLVSLPATPLDAAIESVLAGNPYISPVLAYQQGDWVTAIQEEDGTWRGRLTQITGGFGYWVHARTFETIETMLAETDPATTLPTVEVTQGWNLLGVLDVHQNAQGEAPGEVTEDETGADVVGNGEADDYFTSIPWRVAYTYDTTASLWVKTVPDEGDDDEGGEITNGTGYWVWANSPSTLAP